MNSSTEEYNYSSIYENWSWIQKNNSGFKNMQEGIFRLPVRWKVKVDSEDGTFYYANYRLVVNVSLIDQNDNKIKFSVADVTFQESGIQFFIRIIYLSFLLIMY